jgi:hypothetical protein
VRNDFAYPYIRPVAIDSELRPRESDLSMHASPPVAAPSATVHQRRQIVLVAVAAVVAFALAFGIGKALSSSPETTTAAPAGPQAVKVGAVSIAAGAPAAGTLPALKDEARKAKKHKASKANTTTSTNAATQQSAQQQQQQQTQQVQPQQQQQQVTSQKKQTTKKQPVITSGGGED